RLGNPGGVKVRMVNHVVKQCRGKSGGNGLKVQRHILWASASFTAFVVLECGTICIVFDIVCHLSSSSTSLEWPTASIKMAHNRPEYNGQKLRRGGIGPSDYRNNGRQRGYVRFHSCAATQSAYARVWRRQGPEQRWFFCAAQHDHDGHWSQWGGQNFSV